MAEAALYDYYKDPEFPYKPVAAELTWVPEFIVTNGSKGHRLRRRNGLKVIYKKNPLPWCW
jgi:hypothetical protein